MQLCSGGLSIGADHEIFDVNILQMTSPPVNRGSFRSTRRHYFLEFLYKICNIATTLQGIERVIKHLELKRYSLSSRIEKL